MHVFGLRFNFAEIVKMVGFTTCYGQFDGS